MIEKIKTKLEYIKHDIEKFYDKKVWHFLTLNGVQIDARTTEIQWIFTKYGEIDYTKIFYVYVTKDDIVPCVASILPSALISQMEIVDMFGVEIQNTSKGLYLDEDSLDKPLGNCGIQ